MPVKVINNIGWRYYFGKGISQDYAKAKQWLEKEEVLANKPLISTLEKVFKEK